MSESQETMHCVHVVAYSVDGILQKDPPTIALLQKGELSVLLTSQPDEHLYLSDCADAFSEALLRGTFGGEQLSDWSAWVKGRVAQKQEERIKKYGQSPYLIVSRTTREEVKIGRYVEVDGQILCFDALDKERIRRITSPSINQLISALILATNTIVAYHNVADAIILTREDGKRVFTYTAIASARAFVSTGLSEEIYRQVPRLFAYLKKNKPAEQVANLLALSLWHQQDRFRAFISCWTALELLVNAIFPEYEKDLFTRLTEGASATNQHFYKRIAVVMQGKYGLVDKFALVASELLPESAEADLETFKRIKIVRDTLFHGSFHQDSGLPVEDSQELVKKYLLASLPSPR
jgi:hypothetical protein